MTEIETILLKALEDFEQMRQEEAQQTRQSLMLLSNEVMALREQVSALQRENAILTEQQKQLAEAWTVFGTSITSLKQR